MSTSTPTQQPPTTSSSEAVLTPAAQQALLSNVSLGALIICPILIALPPRKLDAYTLVLLVGTGLGANQVSRDYTGTSIAERFTQRTQSALAPLPPKAMEMQEKIRKEKEARARQAAALDSATARKMNEQKSLGTLAEVEKLRMNQKVQEPDAEEGKSISGALEKVWYGREGKDWKAKRDQREKEALEAGKGYGDLIMEQIWDVWNWGRSSAEEIKGVDEKVVALEEAKKETKK